MKEIEAIRAALSKWSSLRGGVEKRKALLELDYVCNPAAMTAILANIDEQQREIERLRADAERFAFYEKNADKVVQVGKVWYSRAGWSMPVFRRNSFREAIDFAMKETP